MSLRECNHVNHDVGANPSEIFTRFAELIPIPVNLRKHQARTRTSRATMKNGNLVTARCQSLSNLGTQKPRAAEDQYAHSSILASNATGPTSEWDRSWRRRQPVRAAARHYSAFTNL